MIFDLIEKQKLAALKLAVENGADVNIIKCDSYNEMPIHFAAKVGSIEIVEFLINNGADFNAVNKFNETIVHYAASNTDTKLMEYFKESGFALNVKYKNSLTPLMIAVMFAKEAVAEYLIKNIDAIDDTDGNNKTALHYCSKSGTVNIMKALILKGANINAKNHEGKTPLHLVIDNDAKNVEDKVKLLLDHGADIHERDNNLRVPYYYLHHYLSPQLKQRFIDEGSDLATDV